MPDDRLPGKVHECKRSELSFGKMICPIGEHIADILSTCLTQYNGHDQSISSISFCKLAFIAKISFRHTRHSFSEIDSQFPRCITVKVRRGLSVARSDSGQLCVENVLFLLLTQHSKAAIEMNVSNAIRVLSVRVYVAIDEDCWSEPHISHRTCAIYTWSIFIFILSFVSFIMQTSSHVFLQMLCIAYMT